MHVYSLKVTVFVATQPLNDKESLIVGVVGILYCSARIYPVHIFAILSAKIEHRLTLFYVCNDIIQICKRKHALVYKDAFKEVLKDATLLVRLV